MHMLALMVRLTPSWFQLWHNIPTAAPCECDKVCFQVKKHFFGGIISIYNLKIK